MYINLLTKIKNAQAVQKENVKVPCTKMDEKIVDILIKHGYLKDAEKKGRNPKKVIDIKLNYKDKKGVIRGVKFISKPSRRIYVGYRDVKLVKGGQGMVLLSTPKDIMTGKEVRKMKIGGEALFEIW